MGADNENSDREGRPEGKEGAGSHQERKHSVSGKKHHGPEDKVGADAGGTKGVRDKRGFASFDWHRQGARRHRRQPWAESDKAVEKSVCNERWPTRFTSERWKDAASSSSRSRTPIAVTWPSATLLKPGTARARPDQHRPVTAARAITSRKPLRVPRHCVDGLAGRVPSTTVVAGLQTGARTTCRNGTLRGTRRWSVADGPDPDAHSFLEICAWRGSFWG